MTSSENVNIARHLKKLARELGQNQAVVIAKRSGRGISQSINYSDLDRLSDRFAQFLYDGDVRRGDRVLMLVPPSISFFTVTWSLFKLGAVPIFIDPGMGRKNLFNCIQHVSPQIMISASKGFIAKTLFPSAFKKIQRFFGISPIQKVFGAKVPASDYLEKNDSFQLAETSKDELAAILFTSGSTGPPKGVEYTHGIFDTQVSLISQSYGIKSQDTDMPCFPLFGLFSSAMGMRSIIPNMNFSKPAKVNGSHIVNLVNYFNVTSSFGSPALWKTVSDYAMSKNKKMPSLKRILTAGAPISGTLMERVLSVISVAAKIHTPYGATESLPVATISSEEVLKETWAKTCQGQGTCVGHIFDQAFVQIIEINDDPIESIKDAKVLQRFEKGEIIVKGSMVTRAYYNDAKANRLSKIKDADGWWHRIGDIGYFDDYGRLWFCGRKSHRVQTKKNTLFSVCAEAIFNSHPKVARSALVGVDSEPVICIELEEGRASKKLEKEILGLSQKTLASSSVKTLLFHKSFPVDVRHNAKIKREILAQWAKDQL